MFSMMHTCAQAVEGKGLSLKSDVYSYGIILWELLTGQIPYDGKMLLETLSLIVDGKVHASQWQSVRLPRYNDTVKPV